MLNSPILTILNIVLESDNVYRRIAMIKGLDWVTSYFLNLINNPVNKSVVFFDCGYPIAFVIWTQTNDDWFIYEMAVREKYRHTGIVQQVKEMAKESNVKKIQWERKHIRDDMKTLYLRKEVAIYG